jgi:hypothetical protein
LTLLGVIAVVAIPMVVGPDLACRRLRPSPGGFVPDACFYVRGWSARAQGPLGLQFTDQAGLVLRIVLVLGLLATLPLLVPARLRRSVTIGVEVVVMILTVRLWLVAALPGLALSAGGVAAVVAAARASIRSRAAKSPP